MPIIASAKKALKQSQKKNARNRKRNVEQQQQHKMRAQALAQQSIISEKMAELAINSKEEKEDAVTTSTSKVIKPIQKRNQKKMYFSLRKSHIVKKHN